VWGGFHKEISPVGGLGPFNGLEVSEPGQSCCGVGVGCLQFLGPAGSLGELFPEGSEEGVHQALDFGERREQGVLSSTQIPCLFLFFFFFIIFFFFFL